MIEESILDKVPINILYVDNDADDIYFFEDALKAVDIPHTFKSVSSCDEVITLLDLGQKVDLIFLDINMPKVTGIECLHLLKINPQYKDIPVIMYTASKRAAEIDLTFNEGAHFHMIKPFALLNLVASLKIILSFNWKEMPRPAKDKFLIDYTFQAEGI